MFDRFIRFSQARRALKVRRYEEALKLLADPVVAGDRRAAELRDRALRLILARARERAGRNQHAIALADVDLVLALEPEFQDASALRRIVEGQISDRDNRIKAGAGLLEQARERLAQGELRVAEELCRNSQVAAADPAGQATVEKVIAGRRRVAGEVARQAAQALDRGDLTKAREDFLRARSHDPESIDQAFRQRLVQALAADCRRRLRNAGGRQELEPVLAALGGQRGVFPELIEDRALAAELRSTGDRFATEIRGALRKGGLQAGLAIWEGVPALLRDGPGLAGLGAALGSWRSGEMARQRGDLVLAVAELQSAGRRLAVPDLAADLAAARRDLQAAQDGVQAARRMAESGKLLSAREAVAEILEHWPAHDAARREMEILNQQARDREERLQQARSLAGEGRLNAASALLLELAKDDEQGREARLLLKDVSGRMEFVAAGVAQVRRAMHSQATSSEAGLRHCLARVEELGKVQADAEDIAELRQALGAEVLGLEAVGRLGRAVEQRDPRMARDAVTEVLEQRARMQPQRLDARLMDVADTALQLAERYLGEARLQLASEWLAAVAALDQGFPSFAQRRCQCETRVQDGLARAGQHLAEAGEAFDRGEIARMEASLARVRELWIDCPGADKLEQSLRRLSRQKDDVAEVERLTCSQDYAAAERKLRDLPPTPAFLRTRIFDIKQGLAKAQGLAQGFILRVDEGGEFLVLRSDSFTIGNIRDRWADLQLLAKIAGRHARLTRSMSFHGGMEDRILAERGDVHVNGRTIQNQVLSTGDEIALGKTLSMVYSVPSKRSLTALLSLKGGFQVAGTDRILLLKDRGRDGRILVGRSSDCHVRVAVEGPEIEIYGAQDGQIRVRTQGRGEMDGRPFSGEHPVTAGAVVRCGGVSMVLQPWSAAS